MSIDDTHVKACYQVAGHDDDDEQEERTMTVSNDDLRELLHRADKMGDAALADAVEEIYVLRAEVNRLQATIDQIRLSACKAGVVGFVDVAVDYHARKNGYGR